MLKDLFNSIQPFYQPTPKELRETELANCERRLVEMETQAAYSVKMVEYYRETIVRLKDQLGHDNPQVATCSTSKL